MSAALPPPHQVTERRHLATCAHHAESPRTAPNTALVARDVPERVEAEVDGGHDPSFH
jgi:hypothetical protein